MGNNVVSVSEHLLNNETAEKHVPGRFLNIFVGFLLEEALVVVHLQLAFNLCHGVERNADHD